MERKYIVKKGNKYVSFNYKYENYCLTNIFDLAEICSTFFEAQRKIEEAKYDIKEADGNYQIYSFNCREKKVQILSDIDENGSLEEALAKRVNLNSDNLEILSVIIENDLELNPKIIRRIKELKECKNFLQIHTLLQSECNKKETWFGIVSDELVVDYVVPDIVFNKNILFSFCFEDSETIYYLSVETY